MVIFGHMKSRYVFIIVLVTVFLCLDPELALAGPGGAIVKGVFKTWWGKALLTLLAIILAPLTIYIYLKEYFEVRKNRKILQDLGTLNRDFSWLTLDKNVRTIFQRVYKAWNQGDLEEASSLISPWYWQNQQIIHLNDWEKRNLKNVCNVQSISSVKPLYLDITDEENLEGSRIAFSITANIRDYLMHKETKKVVEGSKKFDDEEKIWIMEYTEGKWLLDNIETGDNSLVYAKLTNVIPQRVLAQLR